MNEMSCHTAAALICHTAVALICVDSTRTALHIESEWFVGSFEKVNRAALPTTWCVSASGARTEHW